ncbi:hypothetical protein K7432_018362, partial [Basidiobolus ranarum]
NGTAKIANQTAEGPLLKIESASANERIKWGGQELVIKQGGEELDFKLKELELKYPSPNYGGPDPSANTMGGTPPDPSTVRYDQPELVGTPIQVDYLGGPSAES